jgi:disulfide bond formation protein DsbB
MALNPILDRWRLAALVVSAAMLAIAHGFQTFGGYQPCTLCLRQREVYWVAGTVALVSMILVRLPGGAKFRQLSCWVLGLAFLTGAAIAIYHAGAEWKFWPGPSSCSSAGAGSGVSAAAMQDLLNGAKIRPPACDQAPWVFAGLSMAGWNAVASLGLVVLSAVAALRQGAKT